MFNENGLLRPVTRWTKFNISEGPRSLMTAKWSFLAGTSKGFTPLLTGSFQVIFSPALNLLVFYPGLRIHLKANIDLDFIWQSFFAETDKFRELSHTGFVRMSWSF